jgi:hypothetical protein
MLDPKYYIDADLLQIVELNRKNRNFIIKQELDNTYKFQIVVNEVENGPPIKATIKLTPEDIILLKKYLDVKYINPAMFERTYRFLVIYLYRL